MAQREHQTNTIRWSTFLTDVLICSLGAYGGPEAHFAVFNDHMVTKKRYVSEEELVELIALTGLLPGPSSTQTIVAIGYKVGGLVLAWLTMAVWAIPALMLMTAASFLSQWLAAMDIKQDALRFVGPMAVGFIITAALRIGRKVAQDTLTTALLFTAAVITYFFRQSWVFPLVLITGGLASIAASGERHVFNRVKTRAQWGYLIVFGLLAVALPLISALWHQPIIRLSEAFYRYGYLVIGGGQVVVPLMHSELVESNRYLTAAEFLTGFGLVQGLPGPMFSFSAYAGGMAMRGTNLFGQVAGALLSGIAIFLPGLLLIFFVYPLWDTLKEIKAIRIALHGIVAVAAGLIAASAAVLMQKNGLSWDNALATLATVAVLATKRVPAPLIVAAAILAGFLF